MTIRRPLSYEDFREAPKGAHLNANGVEMWLRYKEPDKAGGEERQCWRTVHAERIDLSHAESCPDADTCVDP